MTDKPAVPKTAIDMKPKIRFNMAIMVRRAFEAKLAVAYLRRKGYEESAAFFEGIATAYFDWFGVLQMTPEQIDEMQLSFAKEEVEKNVKTMVEQVTRATVDKRRILVPGENLPERDIEKVKKIFDIKLGG